MAFKSLTVVAALVAGVLGAVWLSSQLDGIAADEAGAVSAALIAQFEEYAPANELKSPPPDKVGNVALCLLAKRPLDVAEVSRRLAGTLVRVIPAEDCTSKTVEGDFGMFTALTTWYDARGEEAANFEIDQVRCFSLRRCIVDIDGRGAGMRHEVVQTGRNWSVTKSDLRWIV